MQKLKGLHCACKIFPHPFKKLVRQVCEGSIRQEILDLFLSYLSSGN